MEAGRTKVSKQPYKRRGPRRKNTRTEGGGELYEKILDLPDSGLYGAFIG